MIRQDIIDFFETEKYWKYVIYSNYYLKKSNEPDSYDEIVCKKLFNDYVHYSDMLIYLNDHLS